MQYFRMPQSVSNTTVKDPAKPTTISIFGDDSMRSAFREAETEQEADWSLALEYYPDLLESYRRLGRISEKLAFEYRSAMITSKEFLKRHQIANTLENNFLRRYFGTNATIIE